MREIKFRAWDNLLRRMMANVERAVEMSKRPEFEVMQYTGLKDKQGVEIFEGDIVRLNAGNFEVCLLEGCWYLRRKFDKGVSFGRLYETWTECAKEGLPYEVIGNIYENPELLEAR